MEAMPIVNTTHDVGVKFLNSIIFRFDVPKWILTDNDTQFKGAKFTRCYSYFDVSHQVCRDLVPRVPCVTGYNP
jgi:hypothetical protein